MKHTCNFCKTTYTLTREQTGDVECIVCGRISNVKHGRHHKHSFLMLIAAFCALLSAIVFTFVAITNHRAAEIKNNPLIAQISDISFTTDEAGEKRLVISGQVVNRSDKIYGLPDLILTLIDANGNVIANHKFMPSATLLDSKASVKFTHVLNTRADGVKKVTAQLAN